MSEELTLPKLRAGLFSGILASHAQCAFNRWGVGHFGPQCGLTMWFRLGALGHTYLDLRRGRRLNLAIWAVSRICDQAPIKSLDTSFRRASLDGKYSVYSHTVARTVSAVSLHCRGQLEGLCIALFWIRPKRILSCILSS